MIPYVRPSYNLFILDVSVLRYYFETNTQKYSQLNIHPEWYEDIFDWCVREALTRMFVLPEGAVKVSGHYREDIAKCVYDFIGHSFEQQLSHAVSVNQIRIVPGQLKVLVAGTNLIIAQGAPSHARL